MAKQTQLSASLEDYLETIYNIVSEKGGVRAKDIAASLNVKAGSVTTALQALSKSGHVNYQPYSIITLTETGLAEAKRIIRKHRILEDFFESVLGADAKLAEDGACKMEHAIPDELLTRLVAFTDFIQACPQCGGSWTDQFKQVYDKETAVQIRESENMPDQVTQSTLMDIATGAKCIVKRITKKASLTKRLVEMGVGRGALIEVERVAPLGDPIEIKVKGYHLSIRKEEAANIEVDKA